MTFPTVRVLLGAGIAWLLFLLSRKPTSTTSEPKIWIVLPMALLGAALYQLLSVVPVLTWGFTPVKRAADTADNPCGYPPPPVHACTHFG